MIRKYLIGSTLAVLLLAGCGGGSSDTVSSTTGYLVDSAVENVDYDCIADGDYNKTTGADGAFTCQNMHQVRFRLSYLVLGDISALPADGYVFPQDIIGVARDQIENEEVTAMAQLLQSLDEDANLTNGIQISEEAKRALVEDANFTASDLDFYALRAAIQLRTQTEAQEHLRETLQEVILSTGNSFDLSLYPESNLTDAQKYTIAFMWNEEKLAKDLYLALNSIYPTQQLENIATRSETKHQALVEELVQRYDLNITNLIDYSEHYSEEELRAFEPGQFGIQAVQDLYDALYSIGSQSQQDALEVGCMVEVTDINDLNEEIAIAEEVNASDLVAVFSHLRDGSYNHYWAFDTGLKNLGITEGCCALGTIDGINYCHPEYPQNSHIPQ
ncbi:DUF2202 domain-containing protein [Sulfurovum sp. ST-21]|uniref:DUF2202 domain-containing protein n=1 Tax=Sulfurovum indicum TaxID=2779528 RepID=A0A7M1S587_9BACT|nr:DUF2202 domain-containing protein [Sulfurovum indicum]QOR62161.1 DUF2202 domain-containing protein [Sulfurovum indicum]